MAHLEASTPPTPAVIPSPAGKRRSHSGARVSVASGPPDPSTADPGDLPPILSDLTDHVVGLERIFGHELVPNRRNVRRHPPEQQKVIDAALRHIGVSGALLGWRKTPKGQVNLIDGHARVALAPQHRWPVLILDVTERQALQIALTFDRLGAKAQTAQAELEEVSDSVSFMDEVLSADIASWMKEGIQVIRAPKTRHVEFDADPTHTDHTLDVLDPDEYDHTCPNCGHGWDDED